MNPQLPASDYFDLSAIQIGDGQQSWEANITSIYDVKKENITHVPCSFDNIQKTSAVYHWHGSHW